MKNLSMRARAFSSLVGSLSLLVAFGCAEPPSPSAPRTVTVPESPSSIALVGDDLGRLRRAVAQFHNIEAASQGGYSQLTGCMVDPGGAGGMGFHYAKSDAFDGVIDPVKPKALLYEPDFNGRLRLVA